MTVKAASTTSKRLQRTCRMTSPRNAGRALSRAPQSRHRRYYWKEKHWPWSSLVAYQDRNARVHVAQWRWRKRLRIVFRLKAKPFRCDCGEFSNTEISARSRFVRGGSCRCIFWSGSTPLVTSVFYRLNVSPHGWYFGRSGTRCMFITVVHIIGSVSQAIFFLGLFNCFQ